MTVSRTIYGKSRSVYMCSSLLSHPLFHFISFPLWTSAYMYRLEVESGVFMLQTAQCDTQQLFVRSDREATSLVWSQLRPHLYSCDGRMIVIWRWESQKALCVRRFSSADGNPFVDVRVLYYLHGNVERGKA